MRFIEVIAKDLFNNRPVEMKILISVEEIVSVTNWDETIITVKNAKGNTPVIVKESYEEIKKLILGDK